MSRAVKLSTGVFAALGILAIAIGLVLALSNRPATANEMLSLGEQYLLEMRFEQALEQFMGVIDAEPYNPRAYVGAAVAYEGLRQRASAIDILRIGYERTGSIWIAARRAEIDPLFWVMN